VEVPEDIPGKSIHRVHVDIRNAVKGGNVGRMVCLGMPNHIL
jgi:hypothetical protein